MKFPHAVQIGGIVCRIIWGSTTDPEWVNSKHKLDGRFACLVFTKTMKNARIFLHPKLRRNPREAWMALVHELQHFAAEVALLQKVQYENPETRKVRRVRITHDEIFRNDVIFGGLLWENGATLKCVCLVCARAAGLTAPTASSTAR